MRRPLIFMHGIFGCLYMPTPLGKAWGFGPASYIYEPFIENLKTLGYVEGKNLFICYYEWWKNIPDVINTVMSKINEAKIKTGADKVDILCHSMGGLVGRSYIQSSFYRGDVSKLIFLSSPHFGSVNAYYAWEGGVIPPDNNDDFLNILLKGFLWAIGKIKGEKNELMVIRNYIPSLKELMPSKEFGNYIFKYPIVNNKIIFKNILYMKEQNDFLNELNDSINLIYNRVDDIYVFSGNKIYTNKFVQVEDIKDEILWPDGKAIGVVRDDNGDGTVLRKSALGISGKKYVLNEGHGSILNGSIPYLKEILGIEDAPKSSIIEKIASFLSILTDKKVLVLDRKQNLKKYNVFGKVNWYMCFNKSGKYEFSTIGSAPGEIMIHTNKGLVIKNIKQKSRLRGNKVALLVDKDGNIEI